MRIVASRFLIATIAFAGCERTLPTAPDATALQVGRWAGEQIYIQVQSESAVARTRDCLLITFPRPALEDEGRFSVAGTAVSLAGPPGPTYDVVISGRVVGRSLAISVEFPKGYSVGPFTAYLGAPVPNWSPCPV